MTKKKYMDLIDDYLTPEYFPVRIDWSYRGHHFNTVYTGPADKACLEPLATKLYRVYLKEEGIE